MNYRKLAQRNPSIMAMVSMRTAAAINVVKGRNAYDMNYLIISLTLFSSINCLQKSRETYAARI